MGCLDNAVTAAAAFNTGNVTCRAYDTWMAANSMARATADSNIRVKVRGKSQSDPEAF